MNINAATVNLAIWDTAGQERFHALGPIYYRDADGDHYALAACVRKFAFHMHSYVYIDIGLFLFFACLALFVSNASPAGALLVYDITDSESFVKVKNWVKELRKMVSHSSAAFLQRAH